MEKPALPQSANRSGKTTPTKHEENEIDEEQRLLLKQQEKEREEEARKKLEEARLESLNAIREKENKETEEELRNLENLVLSLKRSNKLDPEWERYTRCDGKPDPTSLTQINTFISLTRNKVNCDINIVLEEAQLILMVGGCRELDGKLLEELKKVLDDPEQTQTSAQATIYKDTILSLQDLLLCRYNQATLKLLQEASYDADSETGNLQKVIKGANEVLMLWGNLNKNPRFKSFEFESEQFQFELPKALATTDVAVRILKTSFDHYSHQCSSFNLKDENLVEEELAVEEEKEAELSDSLEDDVDKEKDDVHSTAPPSGRKSQMSMASNKEEENVLKPKEEIPDASTPENYPEPAEKKVDVDRDEIFDPDVVDLRQFHPLGGIYHIDVLEMPPQPKSVKGWVLTEIIDTPLTPLKYHLELPAKTRSRTPSAVSESREGEITPTKAPIEQLPPIGITMRLPSDVMFLEEPQISVWDENDLHWKTKDISNPSFDEEKRVFSFQTRGFGAFSLSQDGHLNMPFQSWELRPKSGNSSLLVITGAITEVEIEIKGTKCRLNPPVDDPPSELSHIHDRWMAVDELIAAMKRAGINMFPAADSHKFVSIQKKEVDLERLYEQMAVLSSSYAFSWSKWNNDVPSSKVVFQVAPFIVAGTPAGPQSVPDDDWSVYVTSNDCCYMISTSEFDDVFSDEIAADCEYHCDVLHAIRSSSKKASTQLTAEKSRSSDALHTDTVATLLKATKLVMFS